MREVEVKIVNVATGETVCDVFACEKDPATLDGVEEIAEILLDEYGPDWGIRAPDFVNIVPDPDDEDTKILPAEGRNG